MTHDGNWNLLWLFVLVMSGVFAALTVAAASKVKKPKEVVIIKEAKANPLAFVIKTVIASLIAIVIAAVLREAGLLK
jgi:uncharacterized protein HemY